MTRGPPAIVTDSPRYSKNTHKKTNHAQYHFHSVNFGAYDDTSSWLFYPMTSYKADRDRDSESYTAAIHGEKSRISELQDWNFWNNFFNILEKQLIQCCGWKAEWWPRIFNRGTKNWGRAKSIVWYGFNSTRRQQSGRRKVQQQQGIASQKSTKPWRRSV